MPYKDPEKQRQKRREWQKDNPKKHNAATLRWRKNHPEKDYKMQRNRHLKRKYKLTMEDFFVMLLEQNGSCAICETDKSGAQNWSIDHDHITGKVRGILCTHCNRGLGGFKDDPKLLLKAIAYLEK